MNGATVCRVTSDRKADRRAAPLRRLPCAALLLATLACSEGATPVTPPAAEGPQATATPAPVEMPAHGEVRMRLDDPDGLTVLANEAPAGPLLDVLSIQLGFELVGPDLGIDPVTIAIQRGPLEEVLRLLLRDRAYRLDYAYDEAGRRHRVSRLEVLVPGAEATAAAAVDPDRLDGLVVPTADGDLLPAGTDADAPEADGSADEDDAIDWKTLVARLDDSDPDERIEALEKIDPEGEGLPLIVDRLARDPDPKVRVVAAEKLEFSDTLAGVDALVAALGDPNREVVLAAIEALELTDDYTVTRDLALLLEHPDGEIREAAREAIDFIEPEPELETE